MHTVGSMRNLARNLLGYQFKINCHVLLEVEHSKQEGEATDLHAVLRKPIGEIDMLTMLCGVVAP